MLSDTYRPAGLTVLLVFRDATAELLRDLPADFQLTADHAQARAGRSRPQLDLSLGRPLNLSPREPGGEIADPAHWPFRGPIAFLRPVVDRQASWP